MSTAEVIKAIKKEAGSDNKIRVAKQFMGSSSNWVTSSDVKQIVSQFAFSDARVEVAQYGYNNVIDPVNFFTVNSAIRSSDEKKKLSDYIEHN
ncbi:unnamed protein product [Brachionus calyciflorus]|uniref:DUF4476 domain-containing protein n=1 Tax=Brachionus calyciflorus TaxID=104777 RepID=A0A813M0I8_9BILA|nr:unnamed protein product [Brachionus calyciflorus]